MGALQEMAGSKKEKWIGGAVRHPGALTAAAKRNGRTTLQEANAESHSKNTHIAARGRLGKRFIQGNV